MASYTPETVNEKKHKKISKFYPVLIGTFIYIFGILSGLGIGSFLSFEKEDPKEDVVTGMVNQTREFNILDFEKNGFQNDRAGIKWSVLAESRFSGVEVVSISDQMGMHFHRGEDHYTYVVSGQGEYLQDGRKIDLIPGKFIFTPMDVAHQVKKTGTDALLLLVFSSPLPFREESIEWVRAKN